jgi:hypothetical protein
MAVAQHRDALRGAEVEILPALGVEQPATLAALDNHVTATGRRAPEYSFLNFGVFHF